MSLGEEERKVMVALEIERAVKTIGEMNYLQQGGLWNTMANRLYYAVFHAVSALLIHDGHKVGTHKGSHVLFSQYYAKTGKLPMEYSELYTQLETMRNEGDYNCYYNVKPEQLMESIPLAKEMIDTIAERVREQ
jgi:uncharacterized protein (UPF0332 family)